MTFSIRGLAWLVAAYYFLQGMGGNPGLHSQSLLKFLYEDWGYSEEGAAKLLAVTMIPWMIKPIYGIISDFLPIFRSRRKAYFVITGLLAAVAYGLLSLINITPVMLMVLLTSAAAAFAFSDVLCDAVMVEKGQLVGATDRLQAAQWTAIGVAGVIVAFAQGYIAHYLSLSAALKLALVFPIAMVVMTILFLREDAVPAARESARNAWRGLKKAARSKPILAAAAFLFLYSCSPNLGTVLYSYEKKVLGLTDIQIGHIGAVGSIGAVVGAAVFGLIAKRLSHALLLKITIIAGTVSSALYLFFVGFWSAVAVSCIATFVYAFAFLGILTVAAKICPKHAEATVFAALMSCMNAGTEVGKIIGGMFYGITGYTPLILIAAAFTACMWFFLPLMRQKPMTS